MSKVWIHIPRLELGVEVFGYCFEGSSWANFGEFVNEVDKSTTNLVLLDRLLLCDSSSH